MKPRCVWNEARACDCGGHRCSLLTIREPRAYVTPGELVLVDIPGYCREDGLPQVTTEELGGGRRAVTVRIEYRGVQHEGD